MHPKFKVEAKMYTCVIRKNDMKHAFIFCLLLGIGFNGFGWGATGHRATGWIAEQHLNAKAKKKIRELLKGESLAMITTWMDDVRSDSTYDYMSDWHWVTVETGQTYDQSAKNPKGDVIMTLERIINELKSKKMDRKKEIEAIKILAHLVGDIHQPLHVGCCDDQGGNKVKVKWFRDDSNLHRVWDSDMIDDSKLSYTELAMALGTPDKEMVKKWQGASVRDWATESMGYRKMVYAIGNGSLGYKYSYKNLPAAKERLLQAGVRLAGILNQIYGK
jgi:hypothetical protein